MITQEQKLQLLDKINVVVSELLEEWALGQVAEPTISVTKQELKDLLELTEEATDAADNAESEARYAEGYALEAKESANKASSKASYATRSVNEFISRFED